MTQVRAASIGRRSLALRIFPMMKLILGGPSYRMEVDARHAAHMVEFALRATAVRSGKYSQGKSDIQILGTAYEHGTPVAYARNHLFEGALAVEDATHLLWLDSDCSFPPDQIPLILHAFRNWVQGGGPLLAVPAPQRNRVLNIWASEKVKETRLLLDGAIHECFAAGFGCVAFDLGWYRKHWPKAPWFRDDWTTVGYVSEDYGHCRALAAMSEKILYAGAYVDHHDRGEGKPLESTEVAR